MGNYALAAFLLIFGAISFGLAIPMWVAGLLAVAAGILLLVGR